MANILKDFPSEKDLKRQIMHTSEIVWQPNGLTEKEINRWLSNFKGEVLRTEEERIMALWLLNHFVFYNEHEIRHLCKLVYKDFIHKKLLSQTGITDIRSAISLISDTFHFHYLGDPSESGSYVLYYFRQENNLPMKNFIKNIDFKRDVDNKIIFINGTIFIDDVTLTGDQDSQAYEFFSALNPVKEGRTLLTFIATKKSIEELKKINVDVISPIILEDRDRCFDSNSEIFGRHKAHLSECERMIRHYGNKLKPSAPLGFKNAQLMFGFFYNTPDNTLPIFWSENNWYPIAKRYDKKKIYHFIEDERFV